MSSATVTTTNMELSPMRVSYGVAGSEVDLGGTLGNVLLDVKYMKSDLRADASGSTVRDRRISGMEFKVTTELSEIQSKSTWGVVFPHATKIGTGVGSLSAIRFDDAMGGSDLAVAKQLILHPLSKADADKSTDYTFFKAVASEESAITYGPTEQSRLKIVWNILPDESVVPNRFFRFGDTTIVQTPASAGSPSFVGTGNGTLTSVVVSNVYTKTETITVTCLGVPVANKSNWSVIGSVSGVIGIAQITSGSPGGSVNFVSNQISFTLTDGSTDFVAGDQFTIATTAAV
jgi:hypothetical protein